METFEIGHLYRAISEMDLIEVQPPPPIAGLKLLVSPESIKTLRAVQKALRTSLGEKPSFSVVLNAMLATADWDSLTEAIAAKVSAQPSQDEP